MLYVILRLNSMFEDNVSDLENRAHGYWVRNFVTTR